MGTPDYIYYVVYMLLALHRPAFTTSWVVQSGGWLPRVLFIPYRIHIYVFQMLFGNVLGYIHIVSGGWVYQPVISPVSTVSLDGLPAWGH